MPLVCRYRPRRTERRTFTAKDAGRVMCATIENGATQQQIEDDAVERGCWVRSDKECERKRRQAVEMAMQLIEGNNQTLAIAQAALEAIGIGLKIALGIIALLPGGAVARAPLVRIQQVTLTQVTKMVVARRSANDDLFQQVIRLAA